MTSLASPPRRRFRPVFLLLLIIAGALLVRALQHVRAQGPPVYGAQWIWSHPDPQDRPEHSYVAWRDFDLDGPHPRALLHIQAEPDWLLSLNGQRVGGDRFRIGDPLTTFEVGPLLRPGRNRILVDLRSSHRIGGLLLALVDDDRALLTTDSSWRVLKRIDPAISSGQENPGASDPVLVIGTSPTGHWGRPRLATPMPRHYTLRSGTPRVPERESRVDFRLAEQDPPSLRRILDFGDGAAGLVHFAGLDGQSTTLTFSTSDTAPDVSTTGEVHSLLRGQRSWTDSAARRFRYLVVDAYPESLEPTVLELDESWVDQQIHGDQVPLTGVFGLKLPIPQAPDDRLRLPAAD